MSIRSLLRATLVVVVTTKALAQQPVVSQPGASDARPTVAVLYFTNGALVPGTDYGPLSKGMAEMLITEISRNPGVRVVERDRLQQLLAEQNLSSGDRVDKETAVKLGKLLGAHHLIMGGFIIQPNLATRIDIRSVNTETSQVEYVETVEGKADNMLAMVTQLGAKVNTGLKLPNIPMRVPGTPGGSAGAVGVVSRVASTKIDQLRAVMMMSSALEAQDRGDVPAAIALYKQAIDADPGFERPKVLLASLENGPKKPTP